MAQMCFDESFGKSDFQSRVRFDFTERAPDYDSGSSGAMRHGWVDRLLASYPPVSPVLDVACGTGYLCGTVSNSGVADVTGLDLTAAMLERGRQQYPSVNFVEGCAESLPFEDARFQCVYITAAMVYFTDIPAALREVYRVLQPGGFLAFQTSSADSYVLGVAFEEACRKVLGAERQSLTFRLPLTLTDTPAEIEKLLAPAGFRDMFVTSHDEVTTLDFEDVTKTWTGGVLRNAFFSRFNLLGEAEKQAVSEKFIECLEQKRDADGVLRDRMRHWFVQCWK